MATPSNLETSRLQLRWLSFDDAVFIHRLVNDPQWLRFIGDKQVSDLDAARDFIDSGPRAIYWKHAFGLNLVTLKDDET